jgi:beta-phosphoglucomutase-like phosphatase (HAD superfamily)
MTTTQDKPWRAGRFGGDYGAPRTSTLGAVFFDLDALTDIECDGHRVAYNAAFAAHGLDVQWTPGRYRQLLALNDERQRVNAELRRRGIATECDVLMKVLADDVYSTKTMMFDELISEARLSPRPGLVEFVTEAAAAGVQVGVVTTGQRSWVEPLVRRLVGEGPVATLVTADDVKRPMPDCEAFEHALSVLDASARSAMAIVGSAVGLRAATAMGLATVVVTGDGTFDLPAAAAVRPDYAGAAPLRVADCQGMHDGWLAAHAPAAVA